MSMQINYKTQAVTFLAKERLYTKDVDRLTAVSTGFRDGFLDGFLDAFRACRDGRDAGDVRV